MKYTFIILSFVFLSLISFGQQFKRIEQHKNTTIATYIAEHYTNTRVSFQIINSITDQLGYTHNKYQQYYNQYPVQHAVLISHTKNGVIISTNDNLQQLPQLDLEILKTKTDIIQQHSLSRKTIHSSTNVILNYGDFIGLCHKMVLSEIDSPFKFVQYYSVKNGELIKTEQLTHSFQAEGIGETVYSGTQTIITDSVNPTTFHLRDYSRGNGIETYSLNNTTDTTNFTDFTDTDNIWDNFTEPLDQYAIDAHWGAEQTYDYFLSQHNRNSIDNNGYKLVNLLHYGNNFVNAFWDGNKMIYGDGNASIGPLVSIDIVGHEITHGVTANSAMLLLEDEPGALNESFSDVFGVLIDWYARPQVANWTVGEEVSSSIRSLADPSVNNDPKYYKGVNWKTLGGADFGGIHSNNGVQNHWFYLLVNGGNDTNEAGNTYSINGIGLEKAAQIVYRNLTVYLTPTSNYAEARFYSILSAQDLYGPCSPEVEAVTNAWFAVGVGEAYIPGNTADFEISYHTACKPFTVNFTNKSQNAESYHWDFGNGDFSNETNPSYVYNEAGTYTVHLISTSDVNCGLTNVKTYTDTIVVTEPLVSQTDTLKTCTTAPTLDLTNKNTTITWYSDSLGENLIDTTKTLAVVNIVKDTSFYYDEGILFTGKTDFTNIGSYNFDVRYQLFDVFEPLQLKAVNVYAYSVGNRTIELRDRVGNVLQSKTVNITSTGESRIPLNFTIFPGKDYQLGVSGTNIGLGRSNGGVNYPYGIPNTISIHRSNAQNAGYSFYYFFYKWEVKKMNCTTEPNQYYIQVESSNPTNTALNHENGKLISQDSLHIYQWYDCGNAEIIPNETNPTFTPTKNGTYALIISNNECNRTDTTECFSINNVSIENIVQKEITIFPNPTNGKIHLQHLPHSIQKIIVKDITGKIIYSENTIPDNSIDISSFKTGVYILTIKMENGEVLNKRIVKN